MTKFAEVVKLVYTYGSEPYGATHEGSSPSSGIDAGRPQHSPLRRG